MSAVAHWCDPSASEWIHSFISDRLLKVKVNTSVSECRALSAGVPQGSHLGPLLFNLSINSLPDVVNHSSLTLFADDANLLCSSPTSTPPSSHSQSVQSDLNQCLQWSNQASAKFNPSKCVHLSFCSASCQPDVHDTYYLGSSAIPRKSSYRHLGVHLTPNLDYSYHVKLITAKFRSRVFLFKHMAQTLPLSASSLLYKAYIRPTTEYAIPIWMFSLLVSEAIKLERLQASACRAYLTKKLKLAPAWSLSKEQLFELCAWESLCWRRHILGLRYFHHVFLRVSFSATEV